MQAPSAVTAVGDGHEGNHTPKASRRSPTTLRFSDQSKPTLPAPAMVSPIGLTSSGAKINPEVRRSFLEKPGDEPPASTILDTFPERPVYDPPKQTQNLAIDTMHVPRYVASSVPMPLSPYGKRSEASSQEVRVHQTHVAPVQVEVHHVKPMMANPEQATLYSDDTDEEDDNVPLASNRQIQPAQPASSPLSPVVTPDEPLVHLVNRLKISSTSSGQAHPASASSPVGTPISAGPLKGGLLSPSNYSKEIDSKKKQFSLPLGPPSPMTPETPDLDDLPLASIAPNSRGLLAEQEHMRLMMMGLSMGMGLGMSMSGNVPPSFSGYPMYNPAMGLAPFGYPQIPATGIYPYPAPATFSESMTAASSKSSKKKHKKDSRHRSTSKSSRSSSKRRSRSRGRDVDDEDDDDVPVRALDLDPRGRSATRKKKDDTPTTSALTTTSSAGGLSANEVSGENKSLPQLAPTLVGEGPMSLSISPILSSSSPRVRDDWQPNSPTREQLVKSRVVRGRLSPSKETSDPLDKKNV
ncbi:hypothetical protein BCR44DRAFT_29393 [Catenaria anguillulae PL171]|uniref:Uncharacterized protein n=1 Tax=Catenaria anguillulae PL171 TaxID=765915 RepID=A0A1Y2HEB2_9FUNG|nr:hypothetical protein BCR44DRAFT_29393 [Catenaria anguillulae PL171]